jgi:hypothetical protein
MAGLALPRGGPIRRFSLFGHDDAKDKSAKLQPLLQEWYSLFTGRMASQRSEKENARLDALTEQIDELNGGPQWRAEYGDITPNTPAAAAPSSSGAAPKKHGFVSTVEDWVVEKVKGKAKDEVMPDSDDIDKQLVWGMKTAAKRFEFASGLVKGDDEQAKHLKESLSETAEKFKSGAETGEKIVNAKEWGELLIEFGKAIEEAADADASTPAGARKLLELMHVGGKLGKKAFPPPLNVEFEFLANAQFVDAFMNVGDAYGNPASTRTTEGKALQELERQRD